ncbi:MAG: M20/M25/M40 family metallo-hydrolase [Actinomycetota bacterium]|nr:M20/M25/M40 family metallo-hydrolase [Actinomycetota bacterium]
MNATRTAPAALAIALLVSACAVENQVVGAPDPVRERPAASAAPVVAATAADGHGLDTFSKANAMEHVRKVASDIGVRVRATRGELRASRYIAEQFRLLGYNVSIQKFEVDDGTSRNVVASWPGSRRYGFVMGGHMDTVPRSPGANDNASGVAVLLELARIVAGKDPSRSVRFVAFGSEEYGSNGAHHVGSQVYVNRLGDEGRRRLGGMISVDMVADGRPLLVGNSGIADDVVARTVYRRLREGGFAVRYHTLCDCSDHGPFEHAGIPASFAYSGPEPNYHEPSDTVSNMDPDDLLRTGRALRVFVKAIDREMLERFRRH